MQRKSSNNSPINNIILMDARSIQGREGSAGFQIIEELERVDKDIHEYYEKRNGNGIGMFIKYLNLLVVLKIAIDSELMGFIPRFSRNTDYQHLLDISIGGVIRNLRIIKMLMMRGYFGESHAAMRMVTQWLETALVLEGDPRLAESIFKVGSYTKLNKSEKHKAINSNQDIKKIHDGMMKKAFGQFSERTHVTKTAINLSKFTDATEGEKPLFSGVISNGMWDRGSLGLAALSKNAVNIFVRHFKKVPVDWENTHQTVNYEFDHR